MKVAKLSQPSVLSTSDGGNLADLDLQRRVQLLEASVREQSETAIRQTSRYHEALRESEAWRLKFTELQSVFQAKLKKRDETHQNEKEDLEGRLGELEQTLETRNEQIKELTKAVKFLKKRITRSPDVLQRKSIVKPEAEAVDKEVKNQDVMASFTEETRSSLRADVEAKILPFLQKNDNAAPLSTAPEAAPLTQQRSEIEGLQAKLAHKEAALKDLRQKMEEIDEENKVLKAELVRRKNLRVMTVDPNLVRELNHKVRKLEEENSRFKNAAEKPYEDTLSLLKIASGTTVSREKTETTDTEENRLSGWRLRKRLEGELKQTQDRFDASQREIEILRTKLARAQRCLQAAEE
ncbi:unnamed protein product [Dibothriocephalus latus]|uniref:Uncharacterized protein n=1 Tax=Dibothriocephalus latus TaxID=60516 RepID=A0A3P6TMD8_DIBLA|nr:unnamed protein product [Dibothriocephalus latus]